MNLKRKLGFNSRSLNHYEGCNAKVGNVLVVHDKEFWNKAPNNKPRQVVVLENFVSKNEMSVLPVKKYKNIKLSNFDGSRELNLRLKKIIPYKRIYKKKQFNNTENSYLTFNEKAILIKKRAN